MWVPGGMWVGGVGGATAVVGDSLRRCQCCGVVRVPQPRLHRGSNFRSPAAPAAAAGGRSAAAWRGGVALRAGAPLHDLGDRHMIVNRTLHALHCVLVVHFKHAVAGWQQDVLQRLVTLSYRDPCVRLSTRRPQQQQSQGFVCEDCSRHRPVSQAKPARRRGERRLADRPSAAAHERGKAAARVRKRVAKCCAAPAGSATQMGMRQAWRAACAPDCSCSLRFGPRRHCKPTCTARPVPSINRRWHGLWRFAPRTPALSRCGQGSVRSAAPQRRIARRLTL